MNRRKLIEECVEEIKLVSSEEKVLNSVYLDLESIDVLREENYEEAIERTLDAVYSHLYYDENFINIASSEVMDYLNKLFEG